MKAFAKINLSLHVLGVRPDGYHELRTIFQAIALFDTLTFTQRPGPFALTCDDPACPAETNLVTRVAAAAWKASGRRGAPRDIVVHLRKRIPMQAGLGGGSSDAAAALGFFARLWRVTPRRVTDIARRLGADVRFFLEGGTALGVRRGDVLVPLAPQPRERVVIVVPPFGVSTKDAYGWLDRDRSTGRKRRAPAATLSNDLEAPVAKRRPEIARIVAQLRRMGATHAAMSGSGSAVFGLFKTAAAAGRAAKSVRGHGRRVEITHTLTGRECRALAAK